MSGMRRKGVGDFYEVAMDFCRLFWHPDKGNSPNGQRSIMKNAVARCNFEAF
jgi:hypothetical protein